MMLEAISRTAAKAGMGMVAGAVGTGVMTLVQTIEMRLTDREPSTMPADALDELVEVAPEGDEKRERFSNLVHWGYGTGLGTVRGLLGATSMPPVMADLTFFAAIWGAPMAFLPALDLSPPPTEWEPKQIALDFAHHAVYAGAVALAWRALTHRDPVS